MRKPRFSIVIPTREGAATLRYTLQTCLAQDHDDFEVIIGDNCSSPALKESITPLVDHRVKYVRSPQPLAMTDSWEFAVAQAAGEYVVVLGDDDGLMLHALTEIDAILRMTGGLALRWECAMYFWPSFPALADFIANELAIPLTKVNHQHAVHHYNGKKLLNQAANSKLFYTHLPLIYGGAIHHSLLTQLREQAGRVFQSRYPDVYSSFALAYQAGTYYSADAPMLIRGIARKSTGLAYFLDRKSSVAEEFYTLNTQANHTRLPGIPDLPVMAAVVADAFQHAKNALFPHDVELAIDRKLLIANCMQQLRVADQYEWKQALDIIRISVRDDMELSAWFEGSHANQPFVPAAQEKLTPAQRHWGDGWLALDASSFGATDVFGAAQLCDKLLGFRTAGTNSRLRNQNAEDAHVFPGMSGKLRLLNTECTRRQVALEEQSRILAALQQQHDQAPKMPRRGVSHAILDVCRRGHRRLRRLLKRSSAENSTSTGAA